MEHPLRKFIPEWWIAMLIDVPGIGLMPALNNHQNQLTVEHRCCQFWTNALKADFMMANGSYALPLAVTNHESAAILVNTCNFVLLCFMLSLDDELRKEQFVIMKSMIVSRDVRWNTDRKMIVDAIARSRHLHRAVIYQTSGAMQIVWIGHRQSA